MFWTLSHADPNAPALLSGRDRAVGQVVRYRELVDLADAFATALTEPAAQQPLARSTQAKQLGLILCHNQPEALVAYLGALRLGDALILLDAHIDSGHLEPLISAYRPDWIFDPGDRWTHREEGRVQDLWGWRLWQARSPSRERPIHPELAVLLSTSGTTGTPRMVRLSYSNLADNAAAIVTALGIDADDRALAALPMHYAYGLSVINSHLLAGAGLVLTQSSASEGAFWQTLTGHQVTTLPAVPITYQMLDRWKPGPRMLTSLRSLMVAGGRLGVHQVERMADWTEVSGRRFYLMYGQTEATARISVMPPEMLRSKPGSVGLCIGAGRLSVSSSGELQFTGPNVMLGYALTRADLAVGDRMHGRLATGDLGWLDADGYVYVSGRLKRMLKIHGQRLSLDALEQGLEAQLKLPVAITGEDDRLLVFLEAGPAKALGAARDVLARRYRLHPSAFTVSVLDALPRTASGKIDGPALRGLDSAATHECPDG